MLRLSGNDFVSLPESISLLFNLRWLYLDGYKRLPSLPDLPSKVERLSVNDCTSLQRLSGPENNICRPDNFSLCFSCINCFKLADNIQSGYNMLQVNQCFLNISVLVFFSFLLNIILVYFRDKVVNYQRGDYLLLFLEVKFRHG